MHFAERHSLMSTAALRSKASLVCKDCVLLSHPKWLSSRGSWLLHRLGHLNKPLFTFLRYKLQRSRSDLWSAQALLRYVVCYKITTCDLWAMDWLCTNFLHIRLPRLSWANQSLSWVHQCILYISSWWSSHVSTQVYQKYSTRKQGYSEHSLGV